MYDFWKQIEDEIMEDIIIHFEDIQHKTEKLAQIYENADLEEKAFMLKEMKEIYGKFDKFVKYYILTFMLKVTKDTEYLKLIYQVILEDDELNKENRYFLFQQLLGEIFNNNDLEDEEVVGLSWQLYDKIYQNYYDTFQNQLQSIPVEERNNDVVLVLTGQFLTMSHGPTKTALDRCYVMSRVFKKKVWLVNTAELMTMVGYVPVFQGASGNYKQEWCNENKIEYLGDTYQFFQCANCMPNDIEIGNILNFVKKIRPYRILQIGGGSVIADLCNELVPSVVVNTVHSKLVITKAKYQLLGRALQEKDIKYLEKMEKTKNHVIECRFTFSLKEQERHYTRKELGFPEDKLLLLVVGARLDVEVSDDFAAMLSQLMEKDFFVVFMGSFQKYEEWCQKYNIWKKNSRYLGFVEDVLAINECCDIYVNPIRNGGGTSVVEAMYKGLPAVTCPIGDVSLGTGEEFQVKDYEEMKEKIIQYKKDTSYYKEMSDKAKKRAAYLLNSEDIFPQAMRQMDEREKE